MLCVVLCYSTLVLGSDHATSPSQLPLNPRIKDTHTQLFIFNLPSWHNYWALLSPLWKNVPLPISPTCPKLQLLKSPDHPPIGAACVATPFWDLTWLPGSLLSKAWGTASSLHLPLSPRDPEVLPVPAIGPCLYLLADQEPIGEQDLSIRTTPYMNFWNYKSVPIKCFLL